MSWLFSYGQTTRTQNSYFRDVPLPSNNARTMTNEYRYAPFGVRYSASITNHLKKILDHDN